MTEQFVYFEQPLNERIRTFLRLELLFRSMETALSGQSSIHHRQAIGCMLEILSVFERGDLKQEIIKEIERLISKLSLLEQSPEVDSSHLEAILAELDQSLDALIAHKGNFGQSLKESDFLYGIRQRSGIAGGTCDFDLPAYHHWLEQSAPSDCRRQIDQWMTSFLAAKNAITLSLEITRQSSLPQAVIAEAGFYQQSLETHIPYQLVRVRMPAASAYFPEISGGRHRFTVRFLAFQLEQRHQQVNEDIPFTLFCCAI